MFDSKKLNILFIAKNIPVPGIRPSRVIIAIAHEISGFCNVSFLYPNEIVPFGFQYLNKYKPFYKLKSWICEGYTISVTKYFRFPYRKMAFWFWNKLSKKDIEYFNSKEKTDLIHAHYLFPDGYLAYLYSKRFFVPYVITIRNSDIIHLKSISKNNPDFKKAKIIIDNAEQILSLNLAYKNFIDEMFNIPSVIIPHGIEKEAFKKEHERKDNTVIITTVSEAIKRKNVDWIINAVKNYNGNKNIVLKIIGTGPLINYYKNLAGGDNRIVFTGKIDRKDVLNNLQNSDIFALPSYSETFGLVYLEAAATHNAIIGLKDEGVWGIFENNKEMLFSKNESHFSNQLYECIENADFVKKLKDRAHNKALTMEWEKIAEKYKDVYLGSLSSYKEKQFQR